MGVKSYFYDKDESTDRTVTDINDHKEKVMLTLEIISSIC
jgi:hypothetical protein